ncbi:MAG: hypothetical protein WBQ25_16050 [Nitrososphaeraceae archaeon]
MKTKHQVSLHLLDISKKVKTKILDLYRIKCPNCGRPKSAISKSLVISYVVECPHCHKDILMNKAKKAPQKKAECLSLHAQMLRKGL